MREINADETYKGSRTVHKVNPGHSISKVVCGYDHTLLLTAEGKVLSSGLGTDGQTGNKYTCPIFISPSIALKKFIITITENFNKNNKDYNGSDSDNNSEVII